MVHRIVVEDQSLRWYGRPPKIADDSIEFVQFQFHLPEEWASLLIVAQFTQSETYNRLVPDDRCFLPVELKAGLCQVSLFGYSEGKPVRATSIPLVFQIEESGFVSSAKTPIPPTPDLYAQLIEYFSRGGTVDEETVRQIVEEYLKENPPVFEESDPTVPEWAKQPTKPEYTAAEVGALPDTYTPPVAPVQSVNGKTGDVELTAEDVGAQPETLIVSYPYEGIASHSPLEINEHIQKGGNVVLMSGDTKFDYMQGDNEEAVFRYVSYINNEQFEVVTACIYADKTVEVEFSGYTIPTIPENVSAFRNDAGYLTEHQDLTGYATEQYVQGYAQPKGEYLTEVPDGYAKTEDIPTEPGDIGAQPETLVVNLIGFEGEMTSDKTPAEIMEAVNSGRTVVANVDGILFSFTEGTDDTVVFNNIFFGYDIEMGADVVVCEMVFVNGDNSAEYTVRSVPTVTDTHINSLIDAKLGVIENGTY